MRKWCKKLGILGGCLLGLGGLDQSAHAQFGAAPSPGSGLFDSAPEPPGPPQAPPGAGPGAEKTSPFSLRDDGTPNAFSCGEAPPPINNYHMSFRTEYLGWWVSPVRIPSALATTSTANPFTTPNIGALGTTGTQVLFGPGNYGYNLLSGGRVTFGLAPGFLPPMEFSGFAIGRSQTLFAAGSSGNTFLFRPVQIVNQPTLLGTPSQAAAFVAGPFIGSGNLLINSGLSLWGVDADMFFNFLDNGVVQFDAIAGYKYADLSERLTITQNTIPSGLAPFNGIAVPAGTTLNLVDNFFTRNQFNGGTLGLRNRILMGRFMLMTDAKLSVGSTFQYLSINGYTTAGGAATAGGGTLALPSNIGVTTRHEVSVIPELTVSLSYQVTPYWRVFGGYNLLYWSNVLRSGNQLQTTIDPRQVPISGADIPGHTGTAPTSPFNTTNFFAHGFNIGMEFAY